MGAAKPEATGPKQPASTPLIPRDLNLPPILAAALTDFQQHGYHGATVRKIASRVGVTMPSLYYHYGSKEGILFALLDLAMDDLLADIQMGLEDPGDDILGRFKNVIMAIALHNTRRHDLATLHDESRFLGTAFRSKYIAKRAIVEETLEGVLETGIAEGHFADNDTHFTSRVLLGLLSGIIDWYREPGALSAREIAERYTQAALRVALKAPPS